MKQIQLGQLLDGVPWKMIMMTGDRQIEHTPGWLIDRSTAYHPPRSMSTRDLGDASDWKENEIYGPDTTIK